MKRLVQSIAALLFLSACGASHDARPVAVMMPPAPVPEYKVGDEFVFDNGVIVDVQRVVAVEPTVVVIESSEIFGTMRQPKAFSNPTNWTGGKYAFLTQITLSNGDLGTIFPLQVGNRATANASGLFSGTRLETRAECVVARQENIQVAAGRFDTFAVECSYTHERGVARFYYWYAPAVGHFVSVTRGTTNMWLKSWKKG